MAKYILKQEAIFALTNEANTHKNPVKRAYTRAAAIIEQITAEDVQPVKHGRWLYLRGEWWKCSSCGQLIYSTRESDRQIMHAYCSRCGARMDGDSE